MHCIPPTPAPFRTLIAGVALAAIPVVAVAELVLIVRGVAALVRAVL